MGAFLKFDLPDYGLVCAHSKRGAGEDFGVSERDFADIPMQDIAHTRYIFPAKVPGRLPSDRVTDPQGQWSFSYHLLAQKPVKTSGGMVRIVDSPTFLLHRRLQQCW